MKSSIAFRLFLILLFSNNALLAQQDSVTTKKIQAKIGLDYSSSLNYYGRTDSLKSAAFTPAAELWFNERFYIKASPIFVFSNAQPLGYVGTVTSIGYEQSSDKWITNINFLKPFYPASATLPQTTLKAQPSISLTSMNTIANVTFGGDVKFSDKADYGATAALDHIFTMRNNDGSSIVIDPSIFAYAGTQRFSRSYVKRKRQNLPLFVTDEQVTESVNKFKILAYEATSSVIFLKRKLMLMVTPSFIIPLNLLVIPSEPGLSEKGENTFYITTGIKYSF